MNATDMIQKLALQAHEEGGYFKQVYKSDDLVTLPDGRVRALATSILFLLTPDSPSHFHRLKSDEIWYYHAGQDLTVHMIFPDGRYETVEIGCSNDAQLQFTVPKGVIFGSTIESQNADDFAVVSCMVSPAFEYEDFELFAREDLLQQYPQHEDIITRLTR